MLPLGYTLGFCVNGILLWVFFQRDFGRRLQEPIRALGQSAAAAVLTGFVAYISLNVLDDVFAIDTLTGIFLQGLTAGVIGTIAGVMVLLLLQSRELFEVWETLKQRISRTHIVAPDSDRIEG
jgi:predicted membrane protein